METAVKLKKQFVIKRESKCEIESKSGLRKEV